MQNRELRRNITLAVSLSGAIAVALAALVPDTAMPTTVRSFIFCFGLLFFVGAALFAWYIHQAIRAMAALARGEDVLARWHVDGAALRAFAAAGHDVEAGPPERHNELVLSEEIPNDGLPVIMGKEAIQIGDDIHVLPRRGTPEVTHAGVYSDSAGAPFAYLQLYYPGYATRNGTQPPRFAMLRFPVAPSALRQAEAAIAYYRDGRPGEADFFHGPGDGTNAEDLSECIHCGYKTHAFKSHCPQCGAALQSRRWARRFGFVLFLCGLPLTIGMGIILYNLTPMLLEPGKDFNGTRFSGTPVQAFVVLGVLSMVLLFGIFALTYGLWQRFTGRRSAWAIAFALAFWSAFLLVPWLLR